MLYEVRNARWERLPRGMRPWAPREVLTAGDRRAVFSAAARRAAFAAEQERAVRLFEDGPRTYWLHRGRVWWEEDDLSAGDVRALVHRRERGRQRQLEHARAVAAAPRRAAIPQDVRRLVFERDGGRCVTCGSDFDLQYDHVIPVALGGGDAAANLQLLCGSCNRAKGVSL